MKNLSRRKLLKMAIGSGVLLASFPTALYMLDRENRLIAHIRGILETNLPGTVIADADVKNFAYDFFIEKDGVSFKRYVGNLLHPVVQFAAKHSEFLYGKVYEFERQVISNFLLNSDFFQNSDFFHSRNNLKAITYYGPVNKVCSTANPFAQFVGDE